MRLVLQYFRHAAFTFPEKFFHTLALVLLLTAMDTALPWGLKFFMEAVIAYNSFDILALGILLFAIFLLARIFIRTRWYISLDRFGGAYIEKLSTQMEKSLSECYYDEIERIGPSIIRNIMFTDTLNVFRIIGHQIPSMFGAITVIVACVFVSCLYSWKIAFFVLFAAVLGFSISWCSRKIVARVAGQTNRKLKVHDSWCGQFAEMLPLIQNHNILGYFQDKTSSNLQDFVETSVREDKKTIFWSGLTSGYHYLFSITLSALLVLPLSNNSVANLVFFTMISDIVMEQAQKIETLFQQILKSLVSLSHVDSLLKLPQRPGTSALEPVKEIQFSSVDYVYPNGVSGVTDISCNLKSGDFVHLCVENGGGKSTFIKLLTGTIKNTAGNISLNGTPLAQIAKEAINQQVVYINQDELLLNETFHSYLETITFRKISQDTLSVLLSHVNLPESDVAIENNGQSLSAGQRKKLLALKFLLTSADASVIILDELTAGLDETTMRKIYADILKLNKQGEKIIIVVDHKMPENLGFTKELRFEEGRLTCCELS